MPYTYNSPYTPKAPNNPGGTKNTHHIFIRANGKIVGRIKSFAPNQNRPVTRVFELNRWSTGRAVDLVPGVVAADTLEVQGLEFWTQSLEEAIGAVDNPITHMADQTEPFEIQEVWVNPNGEYKTITYSGCFMESNNPSAYQADGDKIYMKSCKIQVLTRY